MELEDAAQREAKRTLLAREYGLLVAAVESFGPSLGYRWASKRVASGAKGALVLGSYARNSHDVASMQGCLVEHPRLREAFDALERAACAEGTEPFDERTGQGDLRYVWGKTNGNEVILTLITGRTESRAAASLPQKLEGVAGVCRSIQAGQGNQMRGQQLEVLRGSAELVTRLLDQSVPLGALGFLQPNPEVAEQAYRALTDCETLDGPRALAFDLYAGAGITTRHLQQVFSRVVPCEAYAESAHSLGVAPKDVAVFLQEALDAALRPDLIVANPPRKGLGPLVCEKLLQLASPELRIMSCGPEGFSRDLKQLLQDYELTSLRAFDTLPQTPHIELVAGLRRKTTASP